MFCHWCDIGIWSERIDLSTFHVVQCSVYVRACCALCVQQLKWIFCNVVLRENDIGRRNPIYFRLVCFVLNLSTLCHCWFLVYWFLVWWHSKLVHCTVYSLQRLTMSSNLDSIIGFHFVHNSSNKSDHHRRDTKESRIGWKTMKRKEIDKKSWLNLCLCVCVNGICEYTSTVFAGQTPKAFHPFDDFQFGWKIYMLLYSLVMLQRTREFSRFYVVSRRKSFLARLLLYYPFSSIHFRFDSVNNFLFGRLPHEVATLMDSHWIYSSVWLLLHANYSDDHLGETFFGDEREREWVKKTEAICVFVLRFDSMKLPTDIFVNYFFCKLCLQNIWDSGSTFQLFPCFSSVFIIHAHCTFQIPHINTKFTKS